MKFAEIKEMSSKELLKKKKQIREEYFIAKMKNSLGQLANPIEIRDMRKTLAKIETAISQKNAQ